MKKLRLFSTWILLVIWHHNLFADELKPLRSSQIQKEIEIERNGVLLDQEATAENVLSGKLDGRFRPYKSRDTRAIGQSYWIKFTLWNDTDVNQHYMLGTSHYDYIEFYVKHGRDQDFELTKGGNLFPNKEKKYNVGHFSFTDIRVAHGDTAVVYVLAQNKRKLFFQFVPLDLTLHTYAYFVKVYENINSYILIFLGIVLIMAFYNLALLFITREKAYLYYVGYNISILLYVLALSGSLSSQIFTNAAYQENLVLFTGIAGLVFYVQFSRQILELKTYFRQLDAVLKVVSLLAIAALIPTALNWLEIAIPLCFTIALISYPIILTSAVKLVMEKKHVPATYFLSANVFYITLLMISILQMLGVLPTFIFGLQATVLVQLGVSIELALFSLGLGARIITIREKTLKESETKLTQIIEAMPVGVYVIDSKGKTQYTNKTAKEILQKPVQQEVDKNNIAHFYNTFKAGTDMIYPEEELPIIKALNGVSSTVEDLEIRDNGRKISLQVSARPIYDEKNQVSLSIAVFQDITERLNASRQLKEYSQNLEQKVLERTHEIMLQKDEIEREKRISDELLHNILPEDVAAELKLTGKTEARLFEHVSVLFTDFVDFTQLSEKLRPTTLVSEIHKHFTAFDKIIEKYNLEKIKTIGDAYLAVCGMPKESKEHAILALKAALEIRDYMESLEDKLFRVRIGIHSGPVVAGIVGVKKYAYDIWGDTVNTAARMEQNSQPNKVNISGATYELVKEHFEFEYRGKIDAKHKGQIDMYLVK